MPDEPSESTIGFVGLGSMGGALVTSLVRAGHEPLVYDVDPDRVAEAVGRGARGASSPAEVGSGASLVGVCVATDDQVRSVLEGGLLDSMAEGSTVVLHSTVLPATVTDAAATAASRGVRMVEAPVTGGEDAAREGRITFLLGGDDDDIAAAGPILAACGRNQVRAGPLGNGNLLKLCVNLQTYVTMLGVHEAAGLATALGVSLDSLKEAMEGNGQLPEMIRNYLTLHELTPEVLDDPGILAVRAPRVAIIAKDLRLMAEVGEGAGRDLPAASLAAQRLDDTYFMPRPVSVPGPTER